MKRKCAALIAPIAWCMGLAVLALWVVQPVSRHDTLQYNLSAALLNGDLNGVEAALSAGADVNRLYYPKMPPLRVFRLVSCDTIARGDGRAYFDLLWNRTSRADPPRFERLEILQLLLSHGADPNGAGANSVLMRAVDYHFNGAVKTLLEHGADPNMRCLDGYTAMGCAAAMDNSTAVYLLAVHGGNTNQAFDDGYTPLMLACDRSNYATVEALLRCGADPNLKNRSGETAISRAARSPTLLAILHRGTKSGGIPKPGYGGEAPSSASR